MQSSDLRRGRIALSRGDRARILFFGSPANQPDQIETLQAYEEVEAVVTGSLMHAAETGETEFPVTGDWVMARVVADDLALIEQVLPRTSQIARRAAGGGVHSQVLAANVDVAFLVMGLDGDYNPRRIERYLAIVREGEATPIVLLNKADLAGNAAEIQYSLAQRLRVPVHTISARDGAGLDLVKQALEPGTTAVLLGSSGAGKSTLTNALLGREKQTTQQVRAGDSRGRHTTTERELIQLPSGAWLIDTPGLREIQLLVSEASIEKVFDDIAELARDCQFRDCTHIAEPGCAVRDAIDPDRLESFHKLNRDAVRVEQGADTKQRWRAIHKEMRRFYKNRAR